MTRCSKDHIEALDVESYAGRVNSMGKLVLTDDNSMLVYEEKEMIVIILVNRDYMCFVCEHYGDHILKIQPFSTTVVTVPNKVLELQ